jgi:hypothetical protein
MCSCNYALNIIMEDSTKKVFKPKFRLLFKNVMAFQYIWVSMLRQLYFKAEISGTPGRSSNVGDVSCNP